MIKWLLRSNPALLGDLLEERASGGRSAAWYWRQVAVAVARSIGRDARAHPVLTLRAIVTAFVVYLAAATAIAVSYGYVFGYFYPSLRNVDPMSFWIPLVLVPSTITGWVVARTHRACLEAAIVAIILLWTPQALPMHPGIWIVNLLGFAAGVSLEVRQREQSA